MTVETTIDHPAAEPVSIPWPPAGQTIRHLEGRVGRLTTELERQGRMLSDACMVAEDLRGLALLFHGVFCDTPLTESADVAEQRVASAYLVERMLNSMAERLHAAEQLADTSRKHALAGLDQ